MQEARSEFALQSHEIGALAIDFRPLDLENLSERLRLQAGASDLRSQ